MSAPKVFISYSWDGEEHQQWVLNLANQLVKNGVDVLLDQYENRLGHNLNLFMERVVRDAEKVLLICTENYKTKAENRKGGVGYEYSMINQEWYRNQADNVKFIPVLRGDDSRKALPVFVDAHIYLNMSDDGQFDKGLETLLRNIYDQPAVTKPKLGNRPVFGDDKITINESLSQTSSVDTVIKNQRAREWENFQEELTELEADDLEKMGKLARSIRESRIEHVKQKMTRLSERKGVIVNTIPDLNLPAIDTRAQVLKDLIAQHELNKALKMLLGIASQKGNIELETRVILTSSQYQYWLGQQAEGRFKLEEETKYLTNLQQDLIFLVNNMDSPLEAEKDLPKKETSAESKANQEVIAANFLFIGDVAKDEKRLWQIEEKKAMQAHFKSGKRPIVWEQKEGVTPNIFQEILITENYQFLYFAGHSSKAGIHLLNRDGYKIPVRHLSIFKHAHSLQCVIFCSCESDGFASEVGQYVPYVIAMKEKIRDQFAEAFAGGFSLGLSQNYSIEDSFELGINRIQMNGLKGGHVPVLYVNGQLYQSK